MCACIDREIIATAREQGDSRVLRLFGEDATGVAEEEFEARLQRIEAQQSHSQQQRQRAPRL
jgi:hypothetical protein